MKKIFFMTLIGLFFNSLQGSPIVLDYLGKTIPIDSTLDFSMLQQKFGKDIYHIGDNIPYSGKVSGWLLPWWNRSPHISQSEYFASRIYGRNDVFGRPPKDKKIYVTGQMRKGKLVGEWCYYSEDGTLRSKAHFKNGLIEGKVEFYDENGNIWVSEFKSGKEKRRSK